MFGKKLGYAKLVNGYKGDNSDVGPALYIMTEKGEADLEQVIARLRGEKRLTMSKISYFWESMLESVSQVHTLNIAHCDVKPANFLFVNSQIKLIDFGFAVAIKGGYRNYAIRNFVAGTKGYLSPEAVQVDAIDHQSDDDVTFTSSTSSFGVKSKVYMQSDIWALGVILYQLVYDGLKPYHDRPGGKLSKMRALANMEDPVTFEATSDPDLMETLQMCLNKRPLERPTAQALLKHPFLTGN